MESLDQKSLFLADDGFSTVGMVLALLISLSLIFTCAQVYEVNSVSAQVQEAADAAALAAENTVGEYYIVVTVCDAITFTLSLAMLVTLGLGVVCACIPSTVGFSKVFLDASSKLCESRDSFYESAQSSLESLQQALPFIAAAQAQAVLSANSSDGGSHYVGIVVLAPWQGETSESLTFDQGDEALGSAKESHEELTQSAKEAEEAAQEANKWKERAYQHDSGSKTEYCMYERAAHLANMEGHSNPYFSSVDTWNFEAALKRAQAYYQARYKNEAPADSSVDEQANSALRKRFYAYAIDELKKGYVHETESSFEALFPVLPKNTDEMRRTSLYTDAVYPRTQDTQGMLTLHAWDGCPGQALGNSSGVGPILDMDRNANYTTCPYCKFLPSSMGKVAAASSNIENGFEYHYNEVAQAAEEYQKARSELDPLRDKIKDLAGGIFDQIAQGLKELVSKRIEVLPPGHHGAIALVVDTASPSTHFSSTFVSLRGSETLGIRAAISCATLVRETSDEGKNTVTSFLDGLKSQDSALGAFGIVLDAWSALLGVYAQGQESLTSVVEDVLNGLPLVSVSGLGMWAANAFEEAVDYMGFSPPDLAARKAVLVNSTHVLEADGSTFSAQLLTAKNAALRYGTGSIEGAVSAVNSLTAQAVGAITAEFEIATIVVLEGMVEIPITVSLPSFVSQGITEGIQAGINQLYSVVVSWTGTRSWR